MIKDPTEKQIRIFDLLLLNKDRFGEQKNKEECEKTANSILDIAESGILISDVINKIESIENDDFLIEIFSHIEHICYHLVDSKLFLKIFLQEAKRRGFDK